uniref:Uncharacterized protein n=1 Tax=Arundo donax TaxID=35708 RepID=A0A0A9HL02_ARUDO
MAIMLRPNCRHNYASGLVESAGGLNFEVFG